MKGELPIPSPPPKFDWIMSSTVEVNDEIDDDDDDDDLVFVDFRRILVDCTSFPSVVYCTCTRSEEDNDDDPDDNDDADFVFCSWSRSL